jgi:hypothetical protein
MEKLCQIIQIFEFLHPYQHQPSLPFIHTFFDNGCIKNNRKQMTDKGNKFTNEKKNMEACNGSLFLETLFKIIHKLDRVYFPLKGVVYLARLYCVCE